MSLLFNVVYGNNQCILNFRIHYTILFLSEVKARTVSMLMHATYVLTTVLKMVNDSYGKNTKQLTVNTYNN